MLESFNVGILSVSAGKHLGHVFWYCLFLGWVQFFSVKASRRDVLVLLWRSPSFPGSLVSPSGLWVSRGLLVISWWSCSGRHLGRNVRRDGPGNAGGLGRRVVLVVIVIVWDRDLGWPVCGARPKRYKLRGFGRILLAQSGFEFMSGIT